MIGRLKELNKALQENSDCYLRLTEATIGLMNAVKSIKAYQKRNPIKGKQIVKILKQR